MFPIMHFLKCISIHKGLRTDFNGFDCLGPVYTMDYEVGPWKMAFFHGPAWLSNFHGPISSNINYEAFGPLTRCKLYVDQEEWPCTKKRTWWVFCIYAQEGQFKRIKSSLIVLLSSLVFIFSLCKKNYWKFIIPTFFLPWPSHFSARAPLLPLPPQKKAIRPCQWIM